MTTLVLGKINDLKSSISGGYVDKRTVRFKGYESDGELTFALIIEGNDAAINKILKQIKVKNLDDMCEMNLKRAAQTKLDEHIDSDEDE